MSGPSAVCGRAADQRRTSIRDLLGVGLTGLGVLSLALVVAGSQSLTEDEAQDLLVLGTVGLGSAAAFLGEVAARQAGNVRPSWIAAALAVYTLVVVPSITVWSQIVEDAGEAGDGMAAARLTAVVAIIALLVLAVWPPPRLGHWAPWLGAGVGVLLAAVAAEAAVAQMAFVTVLAGSHVLNAAVVLAWFGTSGWLAASGRRRRDRAVWWMGLGVLLVAAAHALRAAVPDVSPHADLVFGCVLLVSVLTVLLGVLHLIHGGLRSARQEQEELRTAASRMDRDRAAIVERDHELRNALVGLTGITRLLGTSPNGEQEQLRTAALHELGRLTVLLRAETRETAGSYDVTGVLADAVALHRAAGATVALESPPQLRASGSRDVLAQVVGNLLGNCARHAPGAPVVVHADARGDRIVVTVSDDGPGIAPDLAGLVLARGVRGPDSDGLGLGLHLSHQVLAAAGGGIQVHSGARTGGCRVVVELPASAPVPESRTAPA